MKRIDAGDLVLPVIVGIVWGATVASALDASIAAKIVFGAGFGALAVVCLTLALLRYDRWFGRRNR